MGRYNAHRATGTTYTQASYTVPPGCRILLFSDGAYEDAHADGRQLSLTDFKDL